MDPRTLRLRHTVARILHDYPTASAERVAVLTGHRVAAIAPHLEHVRRGVLL